MSDKKHTKMLHLSARNFLCVVPPVNPHFWREAFNPKRIGINKLQRELQPKHTPKC